MVAIHDRDEGQLPTPRAAIYDRIFRLIVSDWTTHRERTTGQGGGMGSYPLDEKRLLFYLPAIAARMLLDSEGRYTLDEIKLAGWLRELMPVYEDTRWARRNQACRLGSIASPATAATRDRTRRASSSTSASPPSGAPAAFSPSTRAATRARRAGSTATRTASSAAARSTSSSR